MTAPTSSLQPTSCSLLPTLTSRLSTRLRMLLEQPATIPSSTSANLASPNCQPCLSKHHQGDPSTLQALSTKLASFTWLSRDEESPAVLCYAQPAQHTHSSGTQSRQQAVLCRAVPSNSHKETASRTAASNSARTSRDGCVNAHMYAGGQAIPPCYALHLLRHSTSSKEPLSMRIPTAHPQTRDLLCHTCTQAAINMHRQEPRSCMEHMP